MRYWLDTEFIEDGKTIDLISIGIVAEDGREYYAISTEFDPYTASAWVVDHVFPCLPNMWNGKPLPMECKPLRQIAIEVEQFLRGTEERSNADGFTGQKPELWAYYADYDWVALCQLYGTMMDLPDGFPMYCRDIKQECDRLGNPELPSQESGEHNALADAKWNKKAWEFLKDYNCNSGCVVNSDLR